jgi:hypothetical protein
VLLLLLLLLLGLLASGASIAEQLGHLDTLALFHFDVEHEIAQNELDQPQKVGNVKVVMQIGRLVQQFQHVLAQMNEHARLAQINGKRGQSRFALGFDLLLLLLLLIVVMRSMHASIAAHGVACRRRRIVHCRVEFGEHERDDLTQQSAHDERVLFIL